MSSLFDVTGISINNNELTSTVGNVQTVTATVDQAVNQVTITTEATPEIVQVQVPGVQGVQNVYAQTTNPATIPGQEWGPEQEGFIWLQI